eukprot:TRINITY_DN7477_c0_g2_i1.p1 TRINITY_DN7477_c0_g2~~TRINITY_DN7477_c0_g2_i1.p1  ORF type:complete len:1049 (+),score=56.44 TRINITY_DN7477_c0_g2_i1:26-3148(+)
MIFSLFLISLIVVTQTLKAVWYKETIVRDLDPTVAWQSWATGAAPQRSPTSDVDDGPFDQLPFCFPFFTTEGATVSISPNGFLSLKPTPLCYIEASAQHFFCHQTNVGYYKLYTSSTGEIKGGDHPLIGVLVEDLDPSHDQSSSVSYWVDMKYGGQRVLVVEWSDVPPFDNPLLRATFQVELMSNGTIIFRFQQVYPRTFRGNTNTAPFVGLVWTKNQRVMLPYPTNGSVIRLDPLRDVCSTYSTCDQCLGQFSRPVLVNGVSTDNPCVWCANINMCVPSDLNNNYNTDYDYCYPLETRTTVCAAPDVSAAAYVQKVSWGQALTDLRNIPAVTTFATAPTRYQPPIAFPFFYNLFNASLSLVSRNGYVSFGSTQCILDNYDSCIVTPRALDVSSAPFLAPLSAVSSASFSVAMYYDGTSLVIQWDRLAEQNMRTLNLESFTFQLIIFSNGTLRFGYLTNSPSTTGLSNYANGQMCTSTTLFHTFPVPMMGLSNTWGDLTSASRFSWPVLSPGTVVTFDPLPGCPQTCYDGKCNHQQRECVCDCAHGTCGAREVNNGRCQKCDPGWAGSRCDIQCTCALGVCNDGIAGDGHCTGNCTSAGATGADCAQCKTGYFGPQCDACPCSARRSCNDGWTGSGTCGGCLYGWTGPNCDQCDYSRGYYGPDCQPCKCGNGTCWKSVNNLDGSCQSCLPGWAGPYCNKPCQCQNGDCSEGISGSGMCSSCQPGWAGQLCNIPCTCVNGICDSGPNGTGLCRSCTGLWAGANCTIECTCDLNHGNCSNTPQSTGTCICQDGWSSEYECRQCTHGHYGSRCVLCTCVYGVCREGVFNDGKCARCQRNYFGENCARQCTCKTAYGVCNDGINGNGHCTSCVDGRTGLDCDRCTNGYSPDNNCQPVEQVAQRNNSYVGSVVVIVIFVLMLLCGCIVVVIFVLFRRRPIPGVAGPVGAFVVERNASGEREVIPIHRVPTQAQPVQGVPLQQIPLAELRAQNLIAEAHGYQLPAYPTNSDVLEISVVGRPLHPNNRGTLEVTADGAVNAPLLRDS